MCWLILIATVAAVIWAIVNRNKLSGYIEQISDLQGQLKQANGNLDFVRGENEKLENEIKDANRTMTEQARRIAELERKLGNQTRPPVDFQDRGGDDNLSESDAAKRTGRMPFFNVFTDDDGQWRWHFKAKNNKIVADSAESYTTKQNVEKGLNTLINSVKGDDYKIKFSD